MYFWPRNEVFNDCSFIFLQVYRANTNFAKEFGAQYSSVSNALQRHERSAKRQDKQNAMTTKVQVIIIYYIYIFLLTNFK